ncbi:MAG: hypothetical protein NTY41_06975 [Proteobacteria bacterium]|nr:hypothetical protein [Pseudomonadota bacterium]
MVTIDLTYITPLGAERKSDDQDQNITKNKLAAEAGTDAGQVKMARLDIDHLAKRIGEQNFSYVAPER